MQPRRPGRPGSTTLFLALLFWGLAGAAGARTAPADSLQQPTPRGALLRSAVLPGWGQYANHRPLKALIFSAAAAGFSGAVIAESRALSRARDPEEYQDRAARRNTRVLLLLATTTFAALDAYVDAHLADFDAAPNLELAADRATLWVGLSWRR